MLNLAITVFTTIILVGMWDASRVQSAQTAAAAPHIVSSIAPDKVGFLRHADLQETWKDLEAKQVINKRALEGGTYSINVRIVKEDEAPLIHAHSIDIWVVTDGSATAITGGELVNPRKNPKSDDEAGTSIRGGNDQPLQAGDVLYIPTGMPHGFKDVKGFRAFLICTDVK
jgi:mannose-6-phosphate isomerase-like protein (cupin superfamily)